MSENQSLPEVAHFQVNECWPCISIVMCTFNGEQYLAQQLDSLAAQSYPAFELIIYDDASSDETLKILSEFVKSTNLPVRLIAADKNVGVTQAFATAIAAATGDFLALTDQDDVWAEDRLERIVEKIHQSPARSGRPRLFVSDVILADEHCIPGVQSHPGIDAFARLGCVSWRDLALGNLLPGCSMVFERELVSEILPIPAEAVVHDWWIALFFACVGDVVFVRDARTYYRLHGKNERGVPSVSKMLSACLKHGPINIGANNFALALSQLSQLSSRIHARPATGYENLESFCELPRLRPLSRPLRLLRVGIRRRSMAQLAVSVVSSLFVNEERVRRLDSPYI